MNSTLSTQPPFSPVDARWRTALCRAGHRAGQQGWRWILWVSLLVAWAGMISACSSKEETATNPPPVAVAGQQTSPSAAEQKKPLKISFLHSSPAKDGGWSESHERGRRALERKFGERIQTDYRDGAAEVTATTRLLQAVIRENDYDLIIATSILHDTVIEKIAAENPHIRFERSTGYHQGNSPVHLYNARTYEGAYLAGILAGSMTHTNILGVVTTMPIPEIVRDVNSFLLGAQSVNPKVQVKVIWLHDWYTPPKETEAAIALFDRGADILLGITDSPTTVQTAERYGKRAIGWNTDMSRHGSRAHLGSAVLDWAPYYIKTVQDVLEGRWQPGTSWWGVRDDVIDLASLAPDVPAAVREKIKQAKHGLINGSLTIWKGPLYDNQGNQVVAAGQVLDDRALHHITYYLQGVAGAVPELRR